LQQQIRDDIIKANFMVNIWILSFIHLLCSLVAWFIVTEKLYFEQVTAGTATTEFAELQVH
jgi:hypothetical protein